MAVERRPVPVVGSGASAGEQWGHEPVAAAMRRLMLIGMAALAACAEESQPRVAATAGEDAVAEGATPPRTVPGQRFERADDPGAGASLSVPLTKAAFSIRCEPAAGRLVFNTTEMPPTGPGRTTMHLSADGFEQSIPAEATEEGLPNTDATVPVDAQWLANLLSASGNLVVRVGKSDPLNMPLSEPLRSLIRGCRRS